MSEGVETPTTRHGKRRDGYLVFGVPMHEGLKARIARIAKRQGGKKAATWARERLTELVVRIEAAQRGARK